MPEHSRKDVQVDVDNPPSRACILALSLLFPSSFLKERILKTDRCMEVGGARATGSASIARVYRASHPTRFRLNEEINLYGGENRELMVAEFNRDLLPARYAPPRPV